MEKLIIIVRVLPRTFLKNYNSFKSNFSLIARRIITYYFLLIASCLLLITPVYSQEDGIREAQINPASPLYFLKSVREVLELKFAGTTQMKAIRELEFANRRISEVKSLIHTSRQDLIEPTLNQYLFYLGELLGAADLNDAGFAARMSGDAVAHMNFLQTTHNQVSDTRAQRSIRATVNSLTRWDLQLIDRLDKSKNASISQTIIVSRLSGCSFFVKEASDSALNEVARAVFSERAETCPTQKL